LDPGDVRSTGSRQSDLQRKTHHGRTRAIDQSHRLKTVVSTWSITMFQLLIGLIQSRDNRGRRVFFSETTEVEGYEYRLMPVFRSFLKSAYADC